LAFRTFVVDARESTRAFIARAAFETFVTFIALVAFLIGRISLFAFRTWITWITRITGIAGHAHTRWAWQIAAWRTLDADWPAWTFGTFWPLGTTPIAAHEQRAASEFAKAGHAIAFQLEAHVRSEPRREVGQFAQAKHSF
jgi:hypothetical protein